MFNFSKNLSAAGLFIVLMMASVTSQAALVSYDFNGSVDSGALSGESYFGSFAFDNATLTNTGNQFIDLSSLTFNFLSSAYSLADADIAATADFLDGTLLGISYSVSNFEPAFSLISAAGTGLPDDVAYFAYTTLSGESGFGSLNIASVPLPGALWLFASSLGMLTFASRRKH